MKKVIFILSILFFSCGKVPEQKYLEKDINYYILLHRENINEELIKQLSSNVGIDDFINFCIIDAYVVSGLDGEFRRGNFGGLHGCYKNFNVDENKQVKNYYNFLASTKKLKDVHTPLDLIHLSFYPKTYPELNLSIEEKNFTQIPDYDKNCVIDKSDVKSYVERILGNNFQLLQIYKKY